MPLNDTQPFEQLISEEEVNADRRLRQKHKRSKKKAKEYPVQDAAYYGPEGPGSHYAEDTSDSPHLESSMSPLMRYLLAFVSDSAEATRGYRLTVTGLIAGAYLIFAAAYGAFERFGVNGFARADILQSKIEDATLPLASKIAKQTDILDRLSYQVTEQLASGTASEIRAKIAKRCMEPPNSSERARLNDEVYRLQQQYRTYKPEYYREPQCSEL